MESKVDKRKPLHVLTISKKNLLWAVKVKRTECLVEVWVGIAE